MDTVLQRAEADKTIALKVSFAETVFNHFAMEFLHSSRQAILKLEFRKNFGEQVKIDSVVSRVCATSPV